MELLFLWIEGFKKIEREAFNFSAEISFKTIKTNKRGKYRIELGVNSEYANPYKSPMVNVTGIAGENGSGKSTLMNCLKLLYGDLGLITSPMIFCHLDREQGTIYTHFYQNGGYGMLSLEVDLDATPDLKKKYEIRAPQPYSISRLGDREQKVHGLSFDFAEISCAYLSGNFDNSPENIYDGIVNVSTKQRLDDFLNTYISKLERDVEREVKNSKGKSNKTLLRLWPSHLRDYYKQELRSNIRMIAYAKSRKLGQLPDLPRNITISFNFDDYKQILENPSQNHQQIVQDELRQIQSRASTLLSNESDKRIVFRKLVYLCIFYHAIRYNLFSNKDNSYTPGDLRGLITSIAESKNDLFEQITISLENLSVMDEDQNTICKLRDLLGEKLQKAIDTAPFINDVKNNDLINFSFRIENSVWNLLNLVFNYQYETDSAFMDYSWDHELSTGEQARLNNYSRLYEIKKKIGRKFLMLLIDEGDLYYHPQWQKHYINDLLDGLKFMFTRNKVQLLLTTHSPFILSDIPRQHMIFLERNVDEEDKVNCTVSKNAMHIQTFGANIHELYTDSFFLRDGLMGEYARIYIDQLIKDINDQEKIDNEEFEAFKNRIDLVGDQFIKAKILELATTKVNIEIVDRIIEDRSNELQQLRNLRELRRRNKND